MTKNFNIDTSTQKFLLLAEIGQWAYDQVIELLRKHKLHDSDLAFILKGFKLPNLRNWESKRLLVDISYILVNFGKYPLPRIDKKIKPHAWLVKIIKEQSRLGHTQVLRTFKHGELKEEFWEKVDCEKPELVNKLKTAVDIIDKTAQKINEEISVLKQRSRRVKNINELKKDLTKIESYKTTLLSTVKKDFFTERKMEDDYPYLCAPKSIKIEKPTQFKYLEALMREGFSLEPREPKRKFEPVLEEVSRPFQSVTEGLWKSEFLKVQKNFSDAKKNEIVNEKKIFNSRYRELEKNEKKLMKSKRIDIEGLNEIEREKLEIDEKLFEMRKQNRYYVLMDSIIEEDQNNSVMTMAITNLSSYSGAIPAMRIINKKLSRQNKREKHIREKKIVESEIWDKYNLVVKSKAEIVLGKKMGKLIEDTPEDKKMLQDYLKHSLKAAKMRGKRCSSNKITKICSRFGMKMIPHSNFHEHLGKCFKYNQYLRSGHVNVNLESAIFNVTKSDIKHCSRILSNLKNTGKDQLFVLNNVDNLSEKEKFFERLYNTLKEKIVEKM